MPYAVKWPDEFVERLQQWRNDHPKIGLLSPSFSKANGSEAVVNDCLEIFERLDDPAGNFNGFDKSDKVEAACKKKIVGLNRAQVVDGLNPAEKERLREQGNSAMLRYHAGLPAEKKTAIAAAIKTRDHDVRAALNEETRAAAASHAETWGVPGAFDEQREFSQRFTDQENIIRQSCKSTSYLQNIADNMFNTRVQLKLTNGMNAPVEPMTVADAVTRFRIHKFAFTAIRRQNEYKRETEFFRGLSNSYPKDRIYYAEIPLPSGCEFLSPLDGAGPAHFRNVYGSGGYPVEQLLEAKGGALKSNGVHNFRDGYGNRSCPNYICGAFKRLCSTAELRAIADMVSDLGVREDVAELLLRMEKHNTRLFDAGIGIAVTNELFETNV